MLRPTRASVECRQIQSFGINLFPHCLDKYYACQWHFAFGGAKHTGSFTVAWSAKARRPLISRPAQMPTTGRLTGNQPQNHLVRVLPQVRLFRKGPTATHPRAKPGKGIAAKYQS